MKRFLLCVGVGLVVGIGLTGYLVLRMVAVAEPDLPGILTHESLSWESRDRTYDVYRPSRPADSPAVVLVLHGSQGDGETARGMMAYEFDRLAEEHGFLVVYPDGFDSHWNGCRAAGPYRANELNVDDVGFLRAIVRKLQETDAVDPQRVFATGVSNGGHMSIRLALEAPDFVRAVAPIAAALPSGDNLGCDRTEEAVGVLLVNGTEDPMNPYEGGTVAFYGVLGNRGTVHSTDETIRYFADLAGYEGEPSVRQLPDVRTDDDSTIFEHRWAAPGKREVVLWEVRGGGHTVPHPEMRFPAIIGPTNADVNASESIWAFFERS